MEKEELLVILNALVEPIFLVNANRRITLVNRAAEELFGEGLVGQDFVRAIRHPDALRCVEEAIAGSTNAQGVIWLPGPTRPTYKVKAVHLDADSEGGSKAVLSLNDISLVRDAEQMRSDFVANVSHELRSPLTALSGGIETLKGAAKGDEDARRKFLDIMEREAGRMNRLIADLLSLSKVEVNEHVRPTDPVDVSVVTEKVIATLEPQGTAEGHSIRLVRPDGECRVPGDEDELTQVFQNLIENAIKYSRPDTEVLVTIQPKERVTGIRGNAVSVEVKDQGEGIAQEHIPRLTERFYRVEGSRSREKGGTGLGLAIVKHIVNRHRGRLAIASEVGKGSTFTVNLPQS